MCLEEEVKAEWKMPLKKIKSAKVYLERLFVLRGNLRRDGMDGVRVCVCVELINLERADIALFIIDVCVQP